MGEADNERNAPIQIGSTITPTLSKKNLMRQVSALGMEDPVFRTKEEGPFHPSNIFDDMSVNDLPEDMREIISIASDPTAIKGDGLDQQFYESVLHPKERGGGEPTVYRMEFEENPHECSIQMDTKPPSRPPIDNSRIRKRPTQQLPQHLLINRSNAQSSSRSLDLEAVFGPERVVGIPGLIPSPNNSSSTHNSQSPQGHAQRTPPHHHQQQDNSDSLMIQAARAMQKDGGNADLANRVLESSMSIMTDGSEKSARRDQIKMSSEHIISNKVAPLLPAMSESCSDNLKAVSGHSAHRGWAFPTAASPTKMGESKRLLPTISSIFPWEESTENSEDEDNDGVPPSSPAKTKKQGASSVDGIRKHSQRDLNVDLNFSSTESSKETPKYTVATATTAMTEISFEDADPVFSASFTALTSNEPFPCQTYHTESTNKGCIPANSICSNATKKIGNRKATMFSRGSSRQRILSPFKRHVANLAQKS